MNVQYVVVAAALIAYSGAGWAEGAKLKDFLVDLSAGHVAAFQLIGLDKTAVTDLQTPKDLVAALQAAGDTDSKSGFGIAYSPGRSGFAPMAVPVVDYANQNKPLARLWGSTTFSYAQNKKTLNALDYSQNAVAVHVGYYLQPKQDPIVAGFDAVVGKIPDCKEALLTARDGLRTDNRSLIQRVKDKQKELRRKLTEEERQALEEAVLSGKTGVSLEKLQICAQNYVESVKANWNASHVDVVLGQGWIKAPTSGAQRLTLGRHAAIALSWGPEEMENSLFNVTFRRTSRELELNTISTSPAYKRTSIVGARYTYGYGEGRSTYMLAEISNAKTGAPTVSSTVFKRALGLDYKLAEGMWLELRAGRALTNDGTKTESKVLFNLKFSPETSLAKDAKGS